MSNTRAGGVEALPSWLSVAARRLRAITGFVTVHPNGGDRRTLAFSRYDHVLRVASLATSISDERDSPRDEVLLLSWLHDINRWPFAHNAEQGRFDPADNLERFAAGRLAADTVRQAADIGRKRVANLSPAARAVLLADIVTGYFEDTFFAITGLNLSPSELPNEALDLLRIPIGDDAFLEDLQYLYLLLNKELDVARYTREFNSIVFRCSKVFLRDHEFLALDPLEDERFWEIRATLREEYMERQIFPLNNDKVCHGVMLREAVVDPALSRLGPIAEDRLMVWTEPDLISYALHEGLVAEETVTALRPSLDYLRRYEPDRCFM